MPKSEYSPAGLARLREPFPPHQISKLPKQSKKQSEDGPNYIKCQICGGWHHRSAVHLDYVGHAALTDRLLECDPLWNWEPVRVDDFGAPVFDAAGGMWIRLTVCGMTRMGYGHANGKKDGDAIKEIIGDALRNAGMRFGMALDLWHKGDLHATTNPDDGAQQNNAGEQRFDAVPRPEPKATTPPATITEEDFQALRDMLTRAGVDDDTVCKAAGVAMLRETPRGMLPAIMRKLQKTIDKREAEANADLGGDNIPF